MRYAVHLVLKEAGGRRHYLCDTRGSNLYATASLDVVSCRRCVNRWNKLVDEAHSNPERIRLALERIWLKRKLKLVLKD